ncbi:MAG: hypothetical protein KGJ86_17880 [Chloroflexota bacterium]|nr:hypothetical protein [Chloroflexota bacterium]
MAVKKISVSLPEELVEEAKQLVGSGGMSGLLAESLERELRSRRLKEAFDWFDKQYGSPGQDDIERAGRIWKELGAGRPNRP